MDKKLQELSNFYECTNNFFDVINVIIFCNSYGDWFENSFLKSFEEWKQNIELRSGNFTRNLKQRMFISYQTYEGLQITVFSIIEARKYLLQNGRSYVLIEKLIEDSSKGHFANIRSDNKRNDNPSLYQLGYSENTVQIK